LVHVQNILIKYTPILLRERKLRCELVGQLKKLNAFSIVYYNKIDLIGSIDFIILIIIKVSRRTRKQRYKLFHLMNINFLSKFSLISFSAYLLFSEKTTEIYLKYKVCYNRGVRNNKFAHILRPNLLGVYHRSFLPHTVAQHICNKIMGKKLVLPCQSFITKTV